MPKSFHPPQRTLLGPGPSDVSPRVLEAMARPTIGHLDPLFVAMMDELKGMLQYAFRTQNALTLPISAPGSAGMETAFVNLLEAGDQVVVCQNGVFGGRMKENVGRCGAIPVMVEDTWGRPVDPNRLEDTLKAHPEVRTVAFVQAETSTGVESDSRTLVEIAHRYDCLAIVDTVTALGGTPVEVDAWDIDAVYSGSQKCLSCTPGLSPVSFNEAAVERIRKRTHKVQSWFLDLNLVMGYWGQAASRTYHHTAPINALYGLHEALVILQEEGIENAWARHRRNHEALRDGLEAMGLTLLVEPEHRLPQLNAVEVPAGIDAAAVRGLLLQDYSIEIGAGLGPLAGKIWRIGLMGHAANARNVYTVLGALENILSAEGQSLERGAAIRAAQAALARTATKSPG